jgi:hypothetical protein
MTPSKERNTDPQSRSPRDTAEPEFHRPPARQLEPWFVRFNRFCVRAWLFAVASVFDLLTWPAKTLGLAVLPEGVKFYVYMWWMTASMLFIWGLTICEKLVLKLRAPRRTDVTAPLKAIANSFFSKVFPTFAYEGRSRARSGSGSFGSASSIAGDADGLGNDCPFVMVHGMAGWGRGTEWLPSYWGGAEAMDRITFTPRLGPMSSQHHRACELFAQLQGGTVDYGEEISHRLGHDRYGRTCVDVVSVACAQSSLGQACCWRVILAARKRVECGLPDVSVATAITAPMESVVLAGLMAFFAGSFVARKKCVTDF